MTITLKALQARARRRPADGAAWAALGAAHAERGELTESVAALRGATRAAPTDGASRAHLALVLEETGDLDGAEAELRAAAALDPSSADFTCRLGSLRDRRPGGAGEARELFVRAIAGNPDFFPAYTELFRQSLTNGSVATAAIESARALQGRGRPDVFDQALACAASLYGHHDECLALSDRVLRHRPTDLPVLIARGDSCVALRDMAGASANFAAAVRWHPLDALATRTLITHAVRLDRWSEARAHFRALWEGVHERYQDGSQAWDGTPMQGEPLLLRHHRPVLVRREAGYGDLIQSIRFAALARERGMRVLVEGPQTLLPFLRTADGVDAVTRPYERGWRIRYRSPWMHLGLLVSPAGAAGHAAYLRVPPRHRTKWRDRLGTGPRRRDRRGGGQTEIGGGTLRVGIAWSVGADHPDVRRMRSIPFELLRALTEISGVRVYSLQVGAETRRLAPPGHGERIVDLGSQFEDFTDTAAAVEQLDLVISVDTSVAHVAGALAVPCWVPLPYCPCFRWGLGGTTTPWYASLRLFRQETPGQWERTITQMCAELRELVQRRAGAPRADGGGAGDDRANGHGAGVPPAARLEAVSR